MNILLDSVFISSLLSNILFLPWFLLSIFLSFYIPGRVVLGSELGLLSKQKFSQTIICIVLGIVLWAYQGVIFGYLHLRFLSYVYILIFLFIWLRKYSRNLIHQKKLLKFGKVTRITILLIALFVVGIFGQTQQFIITAFNFSDGIRGFTVSFEDAFWHTGLTSSLIKSFPPIEPGLTGVEVHNYHYWSNVVIAELVRVFNLPLLSTQYLYMSVLTSFLLGALAYVFAKKLKFSQIGILLFVYLQYFSSDVIYLVTLITSKMFVFNVHPLEDGTMLIENPPRAFSFVILFLGIILLHEWVKNRNRKIGILLVLIIGSLIGYKVHTGFMALGGVGFLCLYLLIKKRFKDLYIGLSALIALCIYIPVNAGAGSALFVPFEMTSRSFAVQEGLNLSRLELARRIYHGHSSFLQALRLDLTMLFIFIIAQFGVRTIGFAPFKKTIQTLSFPLWIVLYGGVLISFALGALFIQPVAPADIFNFFLAGSFFLVILTAVTLNNWLDSKKGFIAALILVVILAVTLPRWIYKSSSALDYFKTKVPIFSNFELQAMNFLKQDNDKNKVVLVFNKDHLDSLYSYVSVFAQKPMFLSGQVIMGRHGIPVEKRERIVSEIYNEKNPTKVERMLLDNSISYLYFYDNDMIKVNASEIGLRLVFKNSKVRIYSFEK